MVARGSLNAFLVIIVTKMLKLKNVKKKKEYLQQIVNQCVITYKKQQRGLEEKSVTL